MFWRWNSKQAFSGGDFEKVIKLIDNLNLEKVRTVTQKVYKYFQNLFLEIFFKMYCIYKE